MTETFDIDSQAVADALVSRFVDFYDGVVVSVFILTEQLSENRLVRVEFDVQDMTATWYRLTLRFSGVERFLFEESPRSYNIVLSDGVKLHVAAGQVIADLWPRPAGDVWVPEDLERAAQYVVAAACTAEITLYVGEAEASDSN